MLHTYNKTNLLNHCWFNGVSDLNLNTLETETIQQKLANMKIRLTPVWKIQERDSGRLLALHSITISNFNLDR